MAYRIPNLWMQADAETLYGFFISELLRREEHAEIVFACRRIRRHAARGPAEEAALFTYSWEIDALWVLEKFDVAWRQLKRRERTLKRHFPSMDGTSFPEIYRRGWDEAPVLYRLGRYAEGCELFEAMLVSEYCRRPIRSLELLALLDKGSEEPGHRRDTTLSHFYRRLGKDLRDWTYWDRFVKGLPADLLKRAATSHAILLADPSLVEHVWVTYRYNSPAQKPLNPTKSRTQQIAKNKGETEHARTWPARKAQIDAWLRKMFPDLA